MSTLKKIFYQIKNDPANRDFTKNEIDPLYSVNPKAKILIIGQAPGRIAEKTQIMWNDKSGDRLRAWLNVDKKIFYDSQLFAVLPMDFYYPGKGKSGDLPPRKGFADKWHPLLIKEMPHIQLTLLIGSYATHHYLHLKSKDKLTDIVHNYQAYLPQYFPLIHPSPRNQIWLSKHKWFEKNVIPDLQILVSSILRQ